VQAGDRFLPSYSAGKKCVRQPLATWLSVRFIMSAFKSLTSTPDFTDLDRIVTDPLCQQLGLDCIGLSRLLQINLEEAGIFPTPVYTVKSDSHMDFHIALILPFASSSSCYGCVLMDVGLHFPLPLVCIYGQKRVCMTNVGDFELECDGRYLKVTQSINSIEKYKPVAHMSEKVGKVGAQNSILYSVQRPIYESLSHVTQMLSNLPMDTKLTFSVYNHYGFKVDSKIANLDCDSKNAGSFFLFHDDARQKVRGVAWRSTPRLPSDWAPVLSRSNHFMPFTKISDISCYVVAKIMSM